MTQNILIRTIKLLLVDALREILFFPIWWYTLGLKKIVLYVLNSISNTNRNLALTVLIKHVFKPMFGIQDRQGRIISFFMRLVLILARSVVFIVITIFNIAIIIFWLLLPVAVVWGLLMNLDIYARS